MRIRAITGNSSYWTIYLLHLNGSRIARSVIMTIATRMMFPVLCHINNLGEAAHWTKQLQRFCGQNYISDLHLSSFEDHLRKQAITVKFKSNTQTNVTSFFKKQWINDTCIFIDINNKYIRKGWYFFITTIPLLRPNNLGPNGGRNRGIRLYIFEHIAEATIILQAMYELFAIRGKLFYLWLSNTNFLKIDISFKYILL